MLMPTTQESRQSSSKNTVSKRSQQKLVEQVELQFHFQYLSLVKEMRSLVLLLLLISSVLAAPGASGGPGKWNERRQS